MKNYFDNYAALAVNHRLSPPPLRQAFLYLHQAISLLGMNDLEVQVLMAIILLPMIYSAFIKYGLQDLNCKLCTHKYYWRLQKCC